MQTDHNVTLIVFSDDWGRHPSSCQHLVSCLLPRYPALWVNTVGTRPPKLSREDLGKIAVKLGQWLTPARAATPGGHGLPQGLRVISPRMWPGFRAKWQRKLNASMVTRAVERALGPRRPGEQRIAITTLPITADLVGRLRVDRWVYYSVDDFGVWPGLDGSVMRDMEALLVKRADRLIAVSPTLQDHLAELGRESEVITHGIDLEFWSLQPRPAAQTHSDPQPSPRGPLPVWCDRLTGPIILFWGLIDQRLDMHWCRALQRSLRARGGGTLVLVGPQQSPDPELAALKQVVMPGAMPYDALPSLAAWADVLVMPYADLPVTRAMQPLKFKEYLGTGKPVVVRSLPATEPWADAADVVDTADLFVERVIQRMADGLPQEHAQARKRLADESWVKKAARFERVLISEQAG